MSEASFDWKKLTLDIMTGVDMIVFSLTLVYALYNGTNFLVVQRRYNNFYLTSFYFLTIMVLGLRMAYFIVTLLTWDYTKVPFEYTWGTIATVAVLAKEMIGGLQIG